MPGQATFPQPKRGEIWFVKFPSDPPEKNPRPVVIVSVDARNQHPRAETVLVVPLSTTLRDSPTHIRLQPGETGLGEACDIQAFQRFESGLFSHPGAPSEGWAKALCEKSLVLWFVLWDLFLTTSDDNALGDCE
jgi:hypothetical protein